MEGRGDVMKFDKVTPPPAAAAAIFFVLAWKRTIRLVDISVGGGLMGKRTRKGRRKAESVFQRFHAERGSRGSDALRLYIVEARMQTTNAQHLPS